MAGRSPSRLSDYQAKRDFSKTAEPSGSEKIAPGLHSRYVIQKHDASHLHYDLRLELDGVFKSWAVTRGPSLNPKDKRLAVQVEDHPLDYGDFEGTIPKGEYGGGTVMIWDRGFWAPETEEAPEVSLGRGQLKFVLAGQKLKGSFVLVRMKRRDTDRRNNWLLIKHRDAFAAARSVSGEDKSVASGRTMRQITRGSGKAPNPFMRRGISFGAAAVWDQLSQQKSRASSATRQTKYSASKAPRLPRLTHPDRALWPGDPPITKQHLAEYLLAVSPRMLPHIQGRPCSFLRAPEGIDGEQFFQRHPMNGQPATLKSILVARGEQPYLQIDDAAMLIAMSQYSAIEFHPWNNAPHQPEVPGRLVFDLDPAPDVPFDSVIDAARELRVVLQSLGLMPFCKTTGGKGLHIVTPLRADPSLTWDQAKLFTHTVAARLVEKSPSRYVTTMSKKRRSGRIFIDYLRNDRTATAVAPFSPRARSGAPVSMPLTWSQVRKGLDPSRFTVRTVPALLDKRALWKGYDTAGRSLRAAIDKLVNRGT